MNAVSRSDLTSKLRSHGLHAPTGADLRHDLWVATSAPVHSTWDEACARADLPAATADPSLEDLGRITLALVGMGGVAGLVGRSMAVRISSYRAIAARGSDAPAPGWDWARNAMDVLLKGRAPRPERLAEVLALDPFAPELRVELDQAASRVAQRLGTALGAVSIVLGSAQCLAGSYGARDSWIGEADGVPVEWSFCATSVRTGEPYVVRDVRDDVLHRLNPTTVHDGVRAYAGAPLITSTGQVLGNCCVIDTVPRDFTDEDVAVLQSEAAAIVAELERRRDERTSRAAAS